MQMPRGAHTGNTQESATTILEIDPLKSRAICFVDSRHKLCVDVWAGFSFFWRINDADKDDDMEER